FSKHCIRPISCLHEMRRGQRLLARRNAIACRRPLADRFAGLLPALLVAATGCHTWTRAVGDRLFAWMVDYSRPRRLASAAMASCRIPVGPRFHLDRARLTTRPVE